MCENISYIKSALHWSRYQDVNPVPATPLAEDLATVLLGHVHTMYDSVHIYMDGGGYYSIHVSLILC